MKRAILRVGIILVTNRVNRISSLPLDGWTDLDFEKLVHKTHWGRVIAEPHRNEITLPILFHRGQALFKLWRESA
jgi:hypothetical protein